MTARYNYEDRHPDEYGADELEAMGHSKTPLLKIIRAKCLDCCCGYKAEVRQCHISDCVLWPYRMATNPLRPPATEKQRQKSREKMRRLQNADPDTRETDNTENGGILAAEEGAT